MEWSRLSMERVKCTVPWPLLEHMEASIVGDHLEDTCSQLFYHTTHNPTCWQMIEELIIPANTTQCSKDMETAMRFKSEGNDAFRASNIQQALDLYTKGIRFLPFGSMKLAILFVNRASASHALGHLMAAVRDCSRATIVQPDYSKAWYRQGRVHADMKWYDQAVEDLEMALFHEASANGKEEILQELERVRALMAIGEEPLFFNCGAGPRLWDLGEVDSHAGISPSRNASNNNQWGMEAKRLIKTGSLLLEEEPIAALVSKEYRDKLCHYCFDSLPPDPVACFKCAIPLYCNEPCLCAATEESVENLDGRKWKGEHMHECCGMSWSVVLPPDVVLAARLFARGQGNARLKNQLKELGHHYDTLSSIAKVEVHILATLLAHCLSYHPISSFEPSMGDLAAELVCLICVVREHAMGLKFFLELAEENGVKLVDVAQGVYHTGSKFDRSCNPNVSAAFKGRRLRVQTLDRVQAGAPLEMFDELAT